MAEFWTYFGLNQSILVDQWQPALTFAPFLLPVVSAFIPHIISVCLKCCSASAFVSNFLELALQKNIRPDTQNSR